MSDVNINYGALQQPNFLNTALQAFQAGRGLAQQRGVQNALAKAGTDPDGAEADLIRYGDLPTAVGIANLGYIGQQRKIIGQAYNALLGGGAPAAAAPAQAPQAQPAADPNAPTPAPALAPQPSAGQPAPGAQPQPGQPIDPASLNPDQVAHALQSADTIDQLGVELSSLPYPQRAARLQQEAPNLVARLGPQAAQQIQNFDPSDANIAQIHQGTAQLRQQLGAAGGTPAAAATPAPQDPNASPPQAPLTGNSLGGSLASQGAVATPPVPTAGTPTMSVSGQPVPPPPPPGPAALAIGGSAPQVEPPAATAQPQPAPASAAGPTAPLPGLNLHDPNQQRALMALQIAGVDIAPMIALGTANLPKYTSVRPGGMVWDDTRGRFVASAPNSEGVQSNLAADGSVESASTVPGYSQAEAEFAGNKAKATAAGSAAGALPYVKPTAQAQSSGQAEGAAPYQMVTVNMPADPQHPGGYSMQMTMDNFKAWKGSGLPGSVPLGQSAGPAAEQFGDVDAQAFGHLQATVASPQNITEIQNKVQAAQQAVHAAMALNPNEFTPQTKAVADLMNTVGLDSSKANNLNYYASLIPKVTEGDFPAGPAGEKDSEAVKEAVTSLQTPRDAAALTFATIAATQNKELAYSKFAAGGPGQYNGPPSERAINQAWLASSDANASIFADPVFRGLTIGGKPAVMVGNRPLADGHVYGIFRPGTPFAQTFRVN